MGPKLFFMLFAAVLLLAGFVVWREARDNAVLSCVSSVRAGVYNLNLSDGGLPDAGPEWFVLSDSDSSRMIAAASNIRPFDCSRVQSGGPHLDY